MGICNNCGSESGIAEEWGVCLDCFRKHCAQTTIKIRAKENMNDPELAAERFQAVVEAYEDGVPRDEAWSTVQERHGRKFEGHLLKASIENVYEEGMGVD